MQIAVTQHDLETQIADMRNAYPRLKDHEVFLVWFLHATVTEDVAKAANALTGNSKDKGADAIIIDDPARAVFVIQGKYRKKVNGANEGRSDVLSFAQLSRDLHGSDADFAALRKELDPRVHQKLIYVRECLKKRNYRLKLYYVTTGKCSKPLRQEAEHVCRRAAGPSSIEIYDGKRVLLALSDYLDGVAPPVPSLDLPLELGHGVTSECSRRHDARNNITAWIFSMNAASVAEMYESAGIRLFARNVRGFLGGNTEVNKGMQETIEDEPWNFWYYNNGITMVCDKAERISEGGRDVMRVSNPQVINGQQTTRTIHACVQGNPAASVLVRAIMVPRTHEQSEQFDSLVSRIVGATNWQNAIRASDLMANDRRQVEIERELRKFNYSYLRKRQSKSEAKRFIGAHHRVVTKEEVAQAVAACEIDPYLVRLGKEGLFEEQLYTKVFPTSDPLFYLTRYRLMRAVSHESKGYPERAYAKWLVLHFAWTHLSGLMRAKSAANTFRECSETGQAPMTHLGRALTTAFRAALKMYKQAKGGTERGIDVSTYFKHKDRAQDFERFMAGPGRQFQRMFDKHWSRFQSSLRSLDAERPRARAAGVA